VDELTSLARSAGRGDRAALSRLVRETQADVWRLCAYLVDPAAADDLAQETYLRAIPALR
jgi:RNA polymerase sigma-70 factor (ECF subfamily)